MPRRKLTKGKQQRVSKKIAKLRREGKSAKEAAGAAYGMADRLGPRGGYQRGKRAKRAKR